MAFDGSLQAAAKELEITDSEENTGLLRQLIIDRIRELIHSDFQKLVSILYRMDVSETKLKRLLEKTPEQDAGVIITELIIERQAQKIKSRQQFSQRDNDINEDEKW